jgi:hypothetical protein
VRQQKAFLVARHFPEMAAHDSGTWFCES